MNETKVIINAKVARALLKLDYRVVDIKPHNQIKYASVFVFESTEGFEEAKDRIINDMKTKTIA